ncbi:MAG: S41 family peptidase [Candidatus Paceibacterota bacterium]
MHEFWKTKQNAGLILLIAGIFALGVIVGVGSQPEVDKAEGLFNKDGTIISRTDFDPFWKAWNMINEKSPDAPNVTNQEKLFGAISGLVSSLNDPYSVFFSPEEAKIFEDEIAGNFSGVGMEVGIKDNVLTVIAPLKDTPAYRVGIMSGDKILQIDDTVTNNMSIDKAIKLIRGEKGTEVSLTIFREGEDEPREIKIVRDTINIPTLDTELRKDGIFVIKLYSFSANSSDLFRNAIRQFAESGSDKLLLDLRGNPGGYLESAVDITSWFLPAGKIVVSEDYGQSKDQTIFRSKGYDLFTDQLKFVILIDGGSASASEIVAGALQDHNKAVLVGAQSYGKGSVQEVAKITGDTLLKITVAKWLTPNGHLIEKVGLTPDYEVEYTKEDAEKNRDPQTDKAVEILLK